MAGNQVALSIGVVGGASGSRVRSTHFVHLTVRRYLGSVSWSLSSAPAGRYIGGECVWWGPYPMSTMRGDHHDRKGQVAESH